MIDNNLNEIPVDSSDIRADMKLADPSGPSNTTVMTDMGASLASFNGSARTDFIIRDQAIADFLAKPYLISSGNFSTSDVSNDVLQSIDVAAGLTTNTFWANKIEGYRLVRGTAVLRIQLAANPFQQGLYIMHFLPSVQIRVDLSDSSYVSAHNATIAGKSQQPHAYVDLRDSAVEIEIPYVTPYQFFDIGDATTNWGYLYLSCISPLITGAAGETTVPYTVWLSFKDWEMAAPCVPQGPGAKKFASKRIAATAKEEKSDSTISVSKVLDISSKVASSLSAIPVIGSLGTTTSWMLRGMSGIASHFGYSKPCVAPTFILGNTQSSGHYYLPNGTGSVIAPSLSLLHDTGVKPVEDTSITDEDEMSFSFIKRVSSIVKSFEWSYGDTVGQLLWSLQVAPFNFGVTGSKTSSGVVANYIQYAPFSYLATQFRFWRGSIELNFKFVKTQFAKGKLLIVFTPIHAETGTTITSPTVYTSNVALRQIIDISQGDEFTINLPYLIPQNFLATNQFSGQLDVFVLNQLRVPETCANYMDIVVTAKAGDDFELAGPMPYANAVPFSPQIGEEISKEGIGSYPIQQLDMEPTSESMGEMFTSIRQLLLRTSCIRSTAGISASASYYFWPWFTTMPYLNAGVLSAGDMGGDAYNFLSQMYSFYRGGIRAGILGGLTIKASSVPIDGYGFWGTSQITPNLSTQGAINWKSTALVNRTGAIGLAAIGDSAGVILYQVPYYNKTRCSPLVNYTTMSGTWYANTLLAQPPVLLNFNATSSITANTFSMMRSIKEDFQFSYFVGCPPILVGDPA